MYLIALCDDEASELKKTENMLSIYRKKHPKLDIMVKCFESADELLYMVREEDYIPDMILLDIYMPEKMGIEAARELRSLGNEGKIIFLTTSKNHALEAFGVGAAQYLVKPVLEEELFPALDKFLKDIKEDRQRYLLLRAGGRTRRVAVNDIVCCEAQGKIQCMYFADGTSCMLRISMAKIVEMLSPYAEFMRVGVAYLVNMEHIECISKQEIRMDTGKKIYPPRGSYQAVRERYFAYYCGE